MLFIHKTTSLCDHCYRHIPGNVIEENNQIVLIKRCPKHGEMKSVIEVDTAFYYSLEHKHEIPQFNQTLFEVTDKCQLSCPHCYHLPDNKTQDRPIDQIVDQLKLLPKNSRPMMAGAEPTLRKDFIDLCKELKFGRDAVDVLTNGIKFANKEFTQSAFNAGLEHACVGLNHWSYQGNTVHNKQLTAIQNLIDCGYWVGYVGYTVETLDHIPDILTEIESLANEKIWHFRIRCGSFIGRSNDKERGYLSKLVKAVEAHYGHPLTQIGPDDNPYHVMVTTPSGVTLRLIQWPDVTNIDMEELRTGPWCQFYDGPVTNFVHQVITRDAYKNMGIEAPDICPVRYHYKTVEELEGHHWKHNWAGPVEVTELDWTYISNPIPIKHMIVKLHEIRT